MKPGFVTFLAYVNIVVVVSGATNINHAQEPAAQAPGSSLYPQATETRDLRTLDGIWNFRQSPADDPKYGYKHKWFEQDLEKTGAVIPMPVPSSYNDVTVNASLRYHVGLVWYDRRFHVPSGWSRSKQRVWLRFSSVHYFAEVWVNGVLVTHHEIGHLPFEVEITDKVHYNDSNLLTVAVDNTLQGDTIPPGTVAHIKMTNKTDHLVQSYNFNFFNYAGIHRTVFLYSTPQVYIDDIIVNTDVIGTTGHIAYNVSLGGSQSGKCMIQLYDKNEKEVVQSQICQGSLKIDNANLWWPYLMHPDPGYLYTMKVTLKSEKDQLVDIYSQKIGIRTVTWTNTDICINNKPVYLRGISMQEDSELRGRGWDRVLWVKNFNLIRWLGANAFRTSHYPYAEEIYQLADEQGVMIIDECPSTNTDYTKKINTVLIKHKQSLLELIRRDRNHPSVIMWSIANAPVSDNDSIESYFSEVVKYVKVMDTSRPVTISYEAKQGNIAKFIDVISFNMYENSLLEISSKVEDQVKSRHKKNNKPVIISGYGIRSISGMHSLPEFMWSEEYQVAVISEYFKAFDRLRHETFFVGEFISNFADMESLPSYWTPLGDTFGIFTRTRQPKASAHHLRARYLELAGAGALAQAYYVSDARKNHDEF